ncbi:hypothetical protein BASA60_001281 [Batrachochytrium salamandrivorans]|nr:hypothetical protein BASA60_001281 [Batrachochytrium salamandrivorans]
MGIHVVMIITTNVIFRHPIHRAASMGHVRILTLLVEAGSKLNAEDIAGNSPLYLAIEQGHNNAAHYLIHAGAEADESKPLIKGFVKAHAPAVTK